MKSLAIEVAAAVAFAWTLVACSSGGGHGPLTFTDMSTNLPPGDMPGMTPPDLVMSMAPPDMTQAVPDMSIADTYPAGPYGSNVGDTIAPLVWEGYINPMAQGLATNAPYGPLAMNDLRKSGKRIALLYAADFF